MKNSQIEMVKCKHTTDGYCIRAEGNYCPSNECKGCDHHSASIVVIEAVASCEKTALQCDYCSELLTEPKTDCR